MYLLQIFVVCFEGITKIVVEALSRSCRIGPNKSLIGHVTAIVNSAEWWDNQGAFWRGYKDREFSKDVLITVIQKKFHKYQSHDYLKEDD